LKRTRAAKDVARVCDPFERPTTALILDAEGVASNANWNVPVSLVIGVLYHPVLAGKAVHPVTADCSTAVGDWSIEPPMSGPPEQFTTQRENNAATVFCNVIFMRSL
jgi:hypothetical protein